VRVSNVSNIRGGSIPDAAYASGADIAMLLVASRYWTPADLVTLDTWASAYGSSLGMTI
jgi:hypothetical protein